MKRPSQKLLATGLSSCIFCGTDTLHDTIELKTKPRYGTAKYEIRIIERCQPCGGYRYRKVDEAGRRAAWEQARAQQEQQHPAPKSLPKPGPSPADDAAAGWSPWEPVPEA